MLFDVGHGAGRFDWQVVETALAQDFPPGTISSDLHHYNLNGPVYDLVTTLSKFLLLGLPLERVLEMVTAAPARAISFPEQVGTLTVGAAGDAVVLALREGSFAFADARRIERTGNQKLDPVTVIRAGRVYDPPTWRGPFGHATHVAEHLDVRPSAPRPAALQPDPWTLP